MEVRKLFYEDSHKKSFSAQIVACKEEDGFWVALDATAFYPEGGGQPCDLGTLNGIRVLDVREKEGVLWHKTEGPLAAGTAVQGELDWQRRFDLMQHHTAEHIISGIAHQLYGCHNVGFHMGADVITLDLDTVLPEDALSKIEKLANEAVFANLPVKTYVPEEQALAAIPYRTKKALSWPVRLVEIPDIDICACCGVHTKYTGELGMIKLLSCVKFHQGVRLEMVCGVRAYGYLTKIFDQNKLVSQAFSAKLLETGAAAQRMNMALSEEKQQRAELEKSLASEIARGFAGIGDALYFSKALSPRPLAEKIAAVCGGVAAVFQGSDKEGYCFALISKAGAVDTLGKRLCQCFSGRGGGRDGFFQGSIKATEKEIREFW